MERPVEQLREFRREWAECEKLIRMEPVLASYFREDYHIPASVRVNHLIRTQWYNAMREFYRREKQGTSVCKEQ